MIYKRPLIGFDVMHPIINGLSLKLSLLMQR